MLIKEKKILLIPCVYERCFAYVYDYDMSNLELLLSSILKIPLEKIKGNIIRLSPKVDLKNKNDKKKELDFLYKIKNLKINVELNIHPKASKVRNINYLTAIHFSEIKKGDNYDKDYKTVQININNESVIDNEDVIEEYYFRNSKGSIYTENIKFLTISVQKLKKICYNNKKKREEYKYLIPFFAEDINIYNEYEGDEVMENMKQRQVVFSEDPNEYVSFRDEDEKEKTYKTGLYIAKEEGIKETQIKIVKTMKEKNIDINTIMELTGLSKKEISEIK